MRSSQRRKRLLPLYVIDRVFRHPWQRPKYECHLFRSLSLFKPLRKRQKRKDTPIVSDRPLSRAFGHTPQLEIVFADRVMIWTKKRREKESTSFIQKITHIRLKRNLVRSTRVPISPSRGMQQHHRANLVVKKGCLYPAR